MYSLYELCPRAAFVDSMPVQQRPLQPCSLNDSAGIYVACERLERLARHTAGAEFSNCNKSKRWDHFQANAWGDVGQGGPCFQQSCCTQQTAGKPLMLGVSPLVITAADHNCACECTLACTEQCAYYWLLPLLN
jgi:hypothetical protein